MSLPLGLVKCGRYGALINVSPNRLVPDAGCDLRLAKQRKRLRIQRRVAAHPENRPMRLPGIEAAKVPAPSTTTAATAATATEPTTTKASAAKAPSAAHQVPPAPGSSCPGFAAR